MSEPRPIHTQGVVPALRSTDYAVSRRFYVERLGFEVRFEWRHEPHLPVFAGLQRGELSLYLTEHAGDARPGGCVYVYVPDVDRWRDEMVARGLEAPAAVDQPWGNRELVLVDPDGNRLVLCTRSDGS